ncbi:hypothetical protein TIFTF001_055346, partial [Ficus carica]
RYPASTNVRLAAPAPRTSSLLDVANHPSRHPSPTNAETPRRREPSVSPPQPHECLAAPNLAK